MSGINVFFSSTRAGAHRAFFVLCGTLAVALATASCSESGDLTGPPPPVDAIAIPAGSLAEAIQGQSYGRQLEATGGSGALSWALSAGTLPSGLTLSPAGMISGTPTAPGVSSFRVRASDAAGRGGSANLSITVVQALAVHSSVLPDAEAGVNYTAQLQAVGGRGTLSWSLSGGAASWLTVSATGVVSGTPPASTAAVTSVTVHLADESGQQVSRPLPLVIRAPLAVAAPALPAATQGRDYAAQVFATGGDGAFFWDIERGALPAGVVLTSAGVLMGTPTAGGAFDFTVRVTDGSGRVATRDLALTVERAPTIQTGGLLAASLGAAYTTQLAAIGGTGTYSWSLVSGALPAGLAFSTDGAISGTPTVEGSFPFMVRVTDQAGATHTRGFTLVVATIQELTSGVAVTGIAGAGGGARYFAIQVPANTTRLTVVMSGGTGDADLYVRRGAPPQPFAYDCRPFRPGNNETCSFMPPFVPPAAGTWYIMVRGYADFAGVSLVATVEG